MNYEKPKMEILLFDEVEVTDASGNNPPSSAGQAAYDEMGDTTRVFSINVNDLKVTN